MRVATNKNLTNTSKLITFNSYTRIKYEKAFLVDSDKLPTKPVL